MTVAYALCCNFRRLSGSGDFAHYDWMNIDADNRCRAALRTALPNASEDEVAQAEKELDDLVRLLLRIALERSGSDASLPIIEID